jgi:hypothetical protein
MRDYGQPHATAEPQQPIVDRLCAVRDRLEEFAGHMHALQSRLEGQNDPVHPKLAGVPPPNSLTAVISQLEDISVGLSKWGDMHARFF